MEDLEKFAEQLRRITPIKRNVDSKYHERQSFLRNCYKKRETLNQTPV